MDIKEAKKYWGISMFLSIFDNEDYESLFGNAYINIDGHYHDEWIDWSGFEE